jgi:hypothetical protein
VQYLSDAIRWLDEHAALGTLIVVGSIVFAIGSLWAVHRFLVTIPPDYFQHEHKRYERWKSSHPALRWTLLIGKNVLGGLLIVAGLVMLVTPGQGILSVLLGLSLLDIPGKRKLERTVLMRPNVLRVANALRARAHQPPLEFY